MLSGVERRAVARVYLTKGQGGIQINGRDYKEYFPQPHVQSSKIVAPFNTVEIDSKIYDLKVRVDGGGFKGQAEAVRMAIARALIKLNEDLSQPTESAEIPDA
jgi:small subunit ribosomal protein S9